jgi:ligand-binding SRPBCC domain-containing protein
MLTQVFRTSQRVSHNIDRVFDFFSRAENLGSITPPSVGFQILTPLPIAMRPGTLIGYRIRLHGIPMKWRTRITVWEPPHRFVDVQEQGPYSLWEHTHRFRPDGPDATVMDDEVRYQLPLGPLGLVALPFVRRAVRGIFDYRRRAVEELLASQGGG